MIGRHGGEQIYLKSFQNTSLWSKVAALVFPAQISVTFRTEDGKLFEICMWPSEARRLARALEDHALFSETSGLQGRDKFRQESHEATLTTKRQKPDEPKNST